MQTIIRIVVYSQFGSMFQVSEHYTHINLRLLRKQVEDTEWQTMQRPKIFKNRNINLQTSTRNRKK